MKEKIMFLYLERYWFNEPVYVAYRVDDEKDTYTVTFCDNYEDLMPWEKKFYKLVKKYESTIRRHFEEFPDDPITLEEIERLYNKN